MKYRSSIIALVLTGASFVTAQTAPLASSHTSTLKSQPSQSAAKNLVTPQPSAKPAVRVNGVVLTEFDVVREMYTIFPYGQQHNGFPKELAPEIRKGAVDMLVFEELLFQQAQKQNITMSPAELDKAMAAFRKQFRSASAYQAYLNDECKGSKDVLRQKINRSFVIEKVLKIEVKSKATVSTAEAKAYYDKNIKEFDHEEMFSIQTISIIPPEDATPAMKQEAKAKITDIVRLAREAKTEREFGLLAEQLSEDDWRTKLGDRGEVPVTKLPPEVTKVARTLKVGEVSDVIPVSRAFVVIRLNGHKQAGRATFAEVQAKVKTDLEKQRTLEIRAALNQKLRKNAKIEVL